MNGLILVLDPRFKKTGEYPRDQEAIEAVLRAGGKTWSDFPDPLGDRVSREVGSDGDGGEVDVYSAGPDKQFGTNDDFAAYTLPGNYFYPYEGPVKSAMREYHKRTGAVHSRCGDTARGIGEARD